MKVQMYTRYCTAERNAKPGEVLDLPEKEAKAIIDGKFGVEVKPGFIGKVKGAVSRAVGGKPEASEEE